MRPLGLPMGVAPRGGVRLAVGVFRPSAVGWSTPPPPPPSCQGLSHEPQRAA